MKFTRVLVCAGVAATLFAASTLCLAQQTSPGYHAVACYKLKTDSAPAFQKWTADEMHKIAQGRIDDGEITAFYLLRAVFSRGEAADCDYLVVTFFPNMPHEFGPEQVDAAIKKTGLKFTGEDYFKHRDALVRLMSVGIFQNEAFAGSGLVEEGENHKASEEVSEALMSGFVFFPTLATRRSRKDGAPSVFVESASLFLARSAIGRTAGALGHGFAAHRLETQLV
jgi:hypothetical protein